MVSGQPLRRRHLKLARVHESRPGRQVGVAAGAVRRWPGSRVGRGDRYLQAIVGVKLVVDRKLQAEGVARAAKQQVGERELTGDVAGWLSVRPAGQTVDRVAFRGFAELKLIRGAGERVLAAVDAVGPGSEQLAGAAWRQFVRLELRDPRLFFVAECGR